MSECAICSQTMFIGKCPHNREPLPQPSAKSEAREWTLWRYKNDWNVVRSYDQNIEEARKVRVIEKSAFDDLTRENESLRAVLENIKAREHCKITELQARISTSERCVLQMQNAAIELTAKLEKAREALSSADSIIHSEFCGSKCHPYHIEIEQALEETK